MNSHLKFALKYLKYYFFAKHKKGQGIYSSFILDVIFKVFRNNRKDNKVIEVFDIYDTYKQNKNILSFKEIGAGTNYNTTKNISIGQITKRSSVNKKYGKLIYDLIRYFKPNNILEIGSSVGISAAYISQAAPKANFKSIEGVGEKIEIAKQIALEINQNTEFILGNFDKILKSVLEKYEKLDFVFFDGNHKKENTLEYFNLCLNKIHEDTVFVFDDIHWSEEMEEAWEEIKSHSKVRVSVDIFRMGLIFFKKELSKENYVVKF
jgi:predicted O-methyltransferase YrrM